MTPVIPFQDRGHGTATERRTMTFFIFLASWPTCPAPPRASPERFRQSVDFAHSASLECSRRAFRFFPSCAAVDPVDCCATVTALLP